MSGELVEEIEGQVADEFEPAVGVLVGLVPVVVADLGGIDNFDGEVVAPASGTAAPAVAF